jgi:hypothetical protein
VSDEPRQPGEPPHTFIDYAGRVAVASDPALLRQALIRDGILVPAEVVNARPPRDVWFDSPPTCKLMGIQGVDR